MLLAMEFSRVLRYALFFSLKRRIKIGFCLKNPLLGERLRVDTKAGLMEALDVQDHLYPGR